MLEAGSQHSQSEKTIISKIAITNGGKLTKKITKSEISRVVVRWQAVGASHAHAQSRRQAAS